MTKAQALFFELLQIALGTREDFSCSPTVEEWDHVYHEAVRQSVVGVCLQAIQRKELNVPIDLKLKWIARGEKIADKNNLLNMQCRQLSAKLTQSGYWNCLLKGQGLAKLYPHPEWRQSGDIDIWVCGNRDKLVEMTRRVTRQRTEVTYHHTDFKVFPHTPVELHFTPTWMANPFTNKRLQRWFKDNAGAVVHATDFTVPTNDFNALFVLLHIYRHILDEGIGMRQIVDYYYVLQQSHNDITPMLHRLHLIPFAKGLMWMMEHTLNLSTDRMIAQPDERIGAWLLNEVCLAGNFGHYDKRNKDIAHHTRWERLLWRLRLTSRRVVLFPQEALWEVPWRIWHYLWRLRNGYLT